MHQRPPAVAGLFYPASAAALTATVRELLAQAPASPTLPSPPKALIVPHAGYIYSGPIAASAYALLQPLRDVIRRVVLLGPAHRVAVHGLALPEASAFATPLGQIALDTAAVQLLHDLPQVRRNAATHAQEHSLEVQLPFLQLLLSDFKLVPLVVGDASSREVAEVLERLWGGPETLIVISSDLSHYHGYDEATGLDTRTCTVIQTLGRDLDHEQACGGTPINGLMEVARRKQLAPHLLDRRNSGDTAGDRDRVVGYAAFAFTEVSRHGH